ncbi:MULTISPECIES: BACON domain-containing protein [Rikenellaceae]|uniref:BACON domain-containing protein n=1 Tax=Alistipes inops TaxID=1501391 RepID=A0ABR4YLU1_9BACT|nr:MULTISPECIES: BACON domain-containing protein [Rikenellaceae]KHE42646.1 hypothetical protein LG35_03385 [Alistipes inops]
MKRLYLTSVSALLLLTGCEQLQSLLDRQISVPDTSQLIQTVSAESTEGETTIDFITQDAWQAAISQPGEERIPEWLSVSPESGDEGGTYSMHIALLPNENNSDRTALITITCGKDEVQARITQKATDDSGNGTGDEDEDEDEDSLIFADGTPQTLTLPAAGGEIDLTFSASGPWQAEITDGVEWIVLSQAAGEAGEHSLTVTVAENAAPVQRAAEITFTCGTSAVTILITQQATETITFPDGTPQTLTLPAAGGEIDLTFSASGPWQAEITDGVEWIVLSQAAGEAGEHSLTITVAENAAPVQRAAEITFTCGTSAVTFSITQQAAEI